MTAPEPELIYILQRVNEDNLATRLSNHRTLKGAKATGEHLAAEWRTSFEKRGNPAKWIRDTWTDNEGKVHEFPSWTLKLAKFESLLIEQEQLLR